MSEPLKPSDPAYWMLQRGKQEVAGNPNVKGWVTKTEVFKAGCYICEDEEFALMGLPLCKPCPDCQKNGRGDGHIPADDEECSECGYNLYDHYEEECNVDE